MKTKIHVYTIEMPKTVHGITTKENEVYSVYINAHDPLSLRLKTYFRGFARVKFGHFECDKPYKDCDKEVNDYAQSEIQNANFLFKNM